MSTTPWTDKEKQEIAQLRKAGRDDGYIIGWMKFGRHGNPTPPLTERTEPMATKKAGKKKVAKVRKEKDIVKKAAGKKTSKKTSKKVVVRKPAAKPGRKKGGFQCGAKLTAVKGQDDSFYKKFPRYAAYQLICAKGSMPTADFVDAVEKLTGVKDRTQALGILTKLLEKECVKASGEVKQA